MADEKPVKRTIGSSVYTKDDEFGVLIHWGDGTLIFDTGLCFDSLDDAKQAGTEILERMMVKLKERGYNAYRPG